MENQEQAQVTMQAPSQPLPELGVADLQNIKIILETCAKRGTFQAQEMSGVGRVYDRLIAFLNAVQAKDESQPSTTDATSLN